MSSEQDVELELSLRERLRIEPLALEEEFVRCPMDIAYLVAVNARAIDGHLRAKAHAKKIRGLLDLQVRQEAQENGRKLNEGAIDALVEISDRWQEVQQAENDAEVARELAKGNLAAMMAKKDMLVQMGANVRAEMERDPMIRKTRVAHRGNLDGGEGTG